MKNLLRILSLMLFASCVSGNQPLMERKIKIWNGSPEEIGICRISTAELAPKIDTVEFILKSYHSGTTDYDCIPADNEEFKKYGCLSFEDIGVLYKYIETLIYSCKEWKQ